MKKLMSYITEIEETEWVQIDVKGTLEGFLFTIFSSGTCITHATISEYADINDIIVLIRELEQSIALYKEKKLEGMEMKLKNIEILNKITKDKNKDYLEMFYKIKKNDGEEVAEIIILENNEVAISAAISIHEPHAFFKKKVEKMFEVAKGKRMGRE